MKKPLKSLALMLGVCMLVSMGPRDVTMARDHNESAEEVLPGAAEEVLPEAAGEVLPGAAEEVLPGAPGEVLPGAAEEVLPGAAGPEDDTSPETVSAGTVSADMPDETGAVPGKAELIERSYEMMARIFDVAAFNGVRSGVLQSSGDDATTTLYYKKGRLMNVAIEDKGAAYCRVTLGAGTKLTGLKEGSRVVSAYNGTQWKGSSDHKLPVINEKKGTLTLKKKKGVPVYTIGIAHPGGMISLRVINGGFDKRIRQAHLIPGRGGKSEAIRLEFTDCDLRSADMVSGVWQVGKTVLCRMDERVMVMQKESDLYATVCPDGTLLLEQKFGERNTTVPVCYYLNGRTFRTSVRIDEKAGPDIIAAREALFHGSDANRIRIIPASEDKTK